MEKGRGRTDRSSSFEAARIDLFWVNISASGATSRDPVSSLSSSMGPTKHFLFFCGTILVCNPHPHPPESRLQMLSHSHQNKREKKKKRKSDSYYSMPACFSCLIADHILHVYGSSGFLQGRMRMNLGHFLLGI